MISELSSVVAPVQKLVERRVLHINLVNGHARWLERKKYPTGVWEVIGSIPVGSGNIPFVNSCFGILMR